MQIKSIEALEQLAVEFLASLSRSESEATVVALRGELGAGKTAFVKAVAKHLGIEQHITSPTFVLIKTYPIVEHAVFNMLVHVDAYRLESGEEILSLGWENLLANSDNLILLEWPERVTNILPKHTTFIDFMFVDENTRRVTTP